MLNKNDLKVRIEKLNYEIESLEKYVNNCPEGKLIVRTNPSGSHRYYVKKKDENGKIIEQYLNKSQRQIAVVLANKEYANACIKDRNNEKQYLQLMLSNECRESDTEKLLLTKPGIAKLVIPNLRQFDDYVTEWKNAKYIRSKEHPEHLTVPTIVPDLIVRSKSESMITSCLVQSGVPFRYEEEHQFGNILLHPDFTCMNPRTHEIFYLEHYGRVDDASYVLDQRWREDQYRKAGIYPWKNLLITTETDNQPLDLIWLKEIIGHYLL